MNRERRALLDHAALCRRVADEISHMHAAKRLRRMAQEYELRAIVLQGIGANSAKVKTEQTHSQRVTTT
jgi:hypothetical protein